MGIYNCGQGERQMGKEKKAKHGGKRAGAGRKSVLKDPVKMLVTLETKQAEKLDEFCKRTSKGKSEAIRNLIDCSPSDESDNEPTDGIPGIDSPVGG